MYGSLGQKLIVILLINNSDYASYTQIAGIVVDIMYNSHG